jgi:hypothetical protein
MLKRYLRTTKNLYSCIVQSGVEVFYSYITPVAIQVRGDLFVCENQWSTTTGRHLTWIDGGDKTGRMRYKDFQELCNKYKIERNYNLQ